MSAIVKPDECRFDPVEHKYYRGLVELPSVTKIITSVWPRSDGAPEDAIEKARLRGTWVDENFEFYLRNGYVVVQVGVPQEYADCLGQAIDWWDANRKGASVECQKRSYGRLYACTPDLIVDGCEILELKSTWEISKTVPAQLGGQGDIHFGIDELDVFPRKLVEPDEGLPVKCGVLHVHRRFKKAQFKEIDYRTAWAQWRCVWNFYRLINGKSPGQ